MNQFPVPNRTIHGDSSERGKVIVDENSSILQLNQQMKQSQNCVLVNAAAYKIKIWMWWKMIWP